MARRAKSSASFSKVSSQNSALRRLQVLGLDGNTIIRRSVVYAGGGGPDYHATACVEKL